MSEEVSKIAEKRRKVKGKGEKERSIHLTAEFQRIARRYKKAFLREKQNGEDQRSFQETQRYQGNIPCKDGHNKGQSGMALPEVEDTKKR